jgi:hypothetical protein
MKIGLRFSSVPRRNIWIVFRRTVKTEVVAEDDSETRR